MTSASIFVSRVYSTELTPATSIVYKHAQTSWTHNYICIRRRGTRRVDKVFATGVSLGPPESSTQTASRSLQSYLPGSLGDRLNDRPTDHASRSVTIGGAHSVEAKFCYCLLLQQVFIGVVVSRLDRSEQPQQSAAIFSCKTLNGLQCI